ncbi:MAG: hypothetical protein COB24_12710 [Hyphomicrobiales bacterium]|nr:MAG: hypothetical protein COB24_12710 [Hyphomicrobiales bacterium]
MIKTKNRNFTSYLALFWLVFWLFNGLDKFLYQTDMGVLTWYGKDRGWQFLTYITNMELSANLVGPILWFAGIWEVAISLFFAIFLWLQIFSKNRNLNIYNAALKISLLTFTGFCAFDIVVGDRAELLEHSIYIGIAGVSYLISYIERMMRPSG